jgi:hypothetical protein
VLEACQAPKIIKAEKLSTWRVRSAALLELEPAVVLVDGSSAASLACAAEAVDKFVASHGVLDVIYEPYLESEPRWWVLVPRTKGVPGHVFALMDQL